MESMPSQHRHPKRALRQIPDHLWAEFGRAAGDAGSDRSAEIRQYIEWRLGYRDDLPAWRKVAPHPCPDSPAIVESDQPAAEAPEMDVRPIADAAVAAEDELIAAYRGYSQVRLSVAAYRVLYRLSTARYHNDTEGTMEHLLAEVRADARALAGRRIRLDHDEAGLRLRRALSAYAAS